MFGDTGADSLYLGPVGDAILTINSGAGGVDSQDWAEMLFRMYRRWAERHGYVLEVIEYTEGEEAGVRSVTFALKGENAFGLLSEERGVHRLVRISPFDAGARRHTSFASVAVSPVVGDEVEINVDQRNLKVDALQDSAVRITHLPSGIVARSNMEHTHSRNREVAMRVLRSRLFEMDREKANRERVAQLRTYVLHPYRLVKDHRSGVETANVDRVLDGDLDLFLGG